MMLVSLSTSLQADSHRQTCTCRRSLLSTQLSMAPQAVTATSAGLAVTGGAAVSSYTAPCLSRHCIASWPSAPAGT